MKNVLPWLVPWAGRAGTIGFCPALAAPSQHKILFSSLFHFISPHRLATWAGSCAGSPVSVSLVSTVSEHSVTLGLSDSGKAYATPTFVRYLVLLYCLC
jgi:hypothetical protein